MTPDTQITGLSGLGKSAKQHFNNVIDGIYGIFATPAGKVCYLQTKATIGGTGSMHSQLTSSLVPAREALNIQEMDFNQLLQRDLDDHRIATKLIPYILNPPANSLPGFFPPIVAILLPFDHQQQPAENFDSPQVALEEDHQYKMKFKMTTHGRAYRIQYLADEDGNLLDPPFAVLRWNPDEAKLVIMDGQHRAMSLIAIERTISKSWHTAPKGARYQPFYEEHVQKWLSKANKSGNPVNLLKIELPVTICWFPERPDQAERPRPHRAARKLFVDVNKTAKPPSEARLVLLSDTELQNIFARELLNRLRRDERWNGSFPLYAVEYDNPVKSVTTPRRWSVVTNLEILKDSVLRAVFGPPKLIEKATTSLQGKPNWQEMNKFMRDRLQVDKLFTKEFHDGPHRLYREGLTNEIFPINDDQLHQKLLDAFYERWGSGVLHLLSHVEPYRDHISTLHRRYTDWITSNNVQTLAKDALFEGVGMFWTIEDGHQLWIDNKKDALDNGLSTPPQPDISRAWIILEEDEKPKFQMMRAKAYLHTDSPSDIKDSERLYQSLITYAAQVGLVMAWASIHHLAGKHLEPYLVANSFSEALNKAISTGPTKKRDRRKILLKSSLMEGFCPLNELPSLDPSHAIHYRYLWLEIALIPDNDNHWSNQGISVDKAKEFLRQCRTAYLEYLIQERRKLRLRDAEIRRLPESEQSGKAQFIAEQEIIESQAKAHQYWFGGKIADCRNMVSSMRGGKKEFRRDLLFPEIEVEEEDDDEVDANDEDLHI